MALTPSGNIVKIPRCNNPGRYGLLASTEPLRLVDPIHFQATGITWEDFLCGPPASGFIDQCPPASYLKPAQRGTNFCSAEPFVAYGSYECPPVGRTSGEAFEIARQRLLTWESYQVEQILWTGQTANGPVEPSFAFGNPECGIVPEDVFPGGALDAVTAIALLEEKLGNTVACGAVIHVPYGLLAYLAKHGLLQGSILPGKNQDTYFSPTGAQIIAGHGYPGTGIANIPAAPGETWIFATGPMVIAEGDVIMVPDNISEAVDRHINNVTVRAEKFFAVGFSCALFGVRVKLTCAGF